MSLRKQLFQKIISFSLLITFVFGCLVSIFLYYSFNKNIKSFIRERNLALKYLIDGHFVKIYNYIKLLSEDYRVRNVLLLGKENKKEVLKTFRSFELSDRDINYIYIGFPDGSLLINNYIPPKDFNSTLRPWYQAALKTAPYISNGIPYREIKNKEWLVSISRVLFDKNDNFAGVIAIDTYLDKITSMLDKKDSSLKSLNSFVLSKEGRIIIHNKQELLRKKIFDVGDFADKKGSIEYTHKGTSKLAYFSYIPQIGWTVVTEVNKREIFNLIWKQMLTSFALVVFVSFLLVWYLSKEISSNIINPILKLKLRVEAILEGKELNDSFKYVENEIGIIARKVESLTKSKLYKKNLELTNLNQELRLLSNTDQLTSLYNRRKMEKELEKEFWRAKRYNEKFSLILFDIDYFKEINDNFGHAVGDEVLKKIALVVKKNIRKSDIVARWGGEEFLILCPETDLRQAVEFAEKLRKIIEAFDFGLNRKVTVSMGLSEYSSHLNNIDELLTIADTNLYKAKNKGRNNIIF